MPGRPADNLEGAYVNPDRTMKTFVVKGGQTTSGINICDWDVNHHGRGFQSHKLKGDPIGSPFFYTTQVNNAISISCGVRPP